MGEPLMGGRPSKYSDELAQEIYERLSNGELLKNILKNTPHMPCWTTVCKWQDAMPEFDKLMKEARRNFTRYMAEEVVEISDDSTHDSMTVGRPGNEYEVMNKEYVARSKLRVETRLKLMSRWNNAEFGEKTTQKHEGSVPVIIEGNDREL